MAFALDRMHIKLLVNSHRVAQTSMWIDVNKRNQGTNKRGWMKAQKIPTLAANLIALRFKRMLSEREKKNAIEMLASVEGYAVRLHSVTQSFLFICLFWTSNALDFALNRPSSLLYEDCRSSYAMLHHHCSRGCCYCLSLTHFTYNKCDIWITNAPNTHDVRHKQTFFFSFSVSQLFITRAEIKMLQAESKHIPMFPKFGLQ